MNPSRNVGQDVPAEILKAARRGQEAVGHVIRTSAGKVRSATPPLHEMHLPFASRLPKPEQLAGNAHELTKRLPKPEELAGNARELARKLPKPEEVTGNVRGLVARLPKPEEVSGNVRGLVARLPKPEEVSGNVRGIAARLPKPEALAGSARELTGKLLASQRRFTDQVLRVTAPQLPGQSSRVRKATLKDGTSDAATPPSQDGNGTAGDTSAEDNGSA